MIKFYSVVSALFNNKSKYGFLTDGAPPSAASSLVWDNNNFLVWGAGNNLIWD